jgi:hypothetical protein
MSSRNASEITANDETRRRDDLRVVELGWWAHSLLAATVEDGDNEVAQCS